MQVFWKLGGCNVRVVRWPQSRDLPDCVSLSLTPTSLSGAPFVMELCKRIRDKTKFAWSLSSSVRHLYVLAKVIPNARGYSRPQYNHRMQCSVIHTLMTSTPLRSLSFQVFPTENDPLELSLDLCMFPVPSLDPRSTVYCNSGVVSWRRAIHTGNDDIPWLLPALFRRHLFPDLYMRDIGLLVSTDTELAEYR